MRGFPTTIATRFDVDELLKTHPTETKAVLQRYLDERLQWSPVGPLSGPNDGITDATHKVVVSDSSDGAATVCVQYELREDEHCTLYRLGFTVAEAEAICHE